MNGRTPDPTGTKALASVSTPWLLSTTEAVTALDTDPDRGLTEAEAEVRLRRHGPNELVASDTHGPLRVLAAQFLNTMTLVLAAAGTVTFIVGDRIDTVVIAVIVVVNALVGFVQEYRAERAMEELGQLSAAVANVVRDGRITEIDAGSLVPGDVVRLTAGDVVPADLRLTTSAELQVAEAALTGESTAVAKTTDALSEDTRFVGDRHNMAFKGTAVTDGRGVGVVAATGMQTELGHIATLLGRERTQTPLQRRLGRLGRRLAAAAGGLCAIVFLLGLVRGEDLDEMLITSISLAVAAIPEGLPAVVTVSLAVGARRMAHRNALVRRLPAVETLGSVSVICTDKTGTLTQNRMSVEHVWTPAAEYEVIGDGYSPEGQITVRSGTAGTDLAAVGVVSSACNDAVLHPPTNGAGWTVTGDPTEGALATLARRLDVEPTGSRVAELPFDAERRRMTTVQQQGGAVHVTTKGALEAIIPLLAPGQEVDAATAAAEILAAAGFRVIALADRTIDHVPDRVADVEHDLRLLGLAGISDPPRPEAQDALEACGRAGVTAVMITGDHPRTASAIGRRMGFLTEDDTALTGDDVAALDDDALTEIVPRVKVFARTAPAQKLRIVEAWRRRGDVVAMTGDGVNDAPALQRADIGVAMGRTGTDVSREAADMVLADDNFATIVAAVGEGRRIYDNLRRFVLYLLTTNSAEVLVMLVAPLLGLPLPLTATQILFVNLITDGLPAVALGLEPEEPDVMDRRPRPGSESILGDGLWKRSLTVGSVMAAAVIGVQLIGEARGLAWQTMGFVCLAVFQLSHAIAVRSRSHPLSELLGVNPLLAVAVLGSLVVQLAVVYVPFLQPAFDTEPLDAGELGIVAAVCVAGFVIGEVERKRRR